MGALAEVPGIIMGGNAQAGADKARAQELTQQSKLVQAQGQEQQASRIDALNRSLSAITALTASRGLNIDSPSAQAIRGNRKQVAQTDVETIGANAAAQAGLLREDASAANAAASNAQMNSWFQALATIDSAGTKLAMGG